MTGPEKIEACFLHQSHLAYLCIIERHRTDYAIVVVHAATVQQQRLAVEPESVLRIIRERAYAEWYGGMSQQSPLFCK